MANKTNKRNKINTESGNAETARDKGVTSTDLLDSWLLRFFRYLDFIFNRSAFGKNNKHCVFKVSLSSLDEVYSSVPKLKQGFCFIHQKFCLGQIDKSSKFSSVKITFRDRSTGLYLGQYSVPVIKCIGNIKIPIARKGKFHEEVRVLRISKE